MRSEDRVVAKMGDINSGATDRVTKRPRNNGVVGGSKGLDVRPPR